MNTDHIEDVRGRSMADAAVGPCDCDPHIEHCPSCAPYLHQPLKPAGEEDKATYKQIADNYTSTADCPRCAELLASEHALSDAYIRLRTKLNAFNTPTAPTAEQVWKHTEECLDRLLDKLAALEAENARLIQQVNAFYLANPQGGIVTRLQATIAQQTKQIKKLESQLEIQLTQTKES